MAELDHFHDKILDMRTLGSHSNAPFYKRKLLVVEDKTRESNDKNYLDFESFFVFFVFAAVGVGALRTACVSELTNKE